MSFNYGSRNYGQGIYGGFDNAYALSAIPAIIELYDNSGAYKNTFQTGVGDFLGCEFTLEESGPKDFVLYFAKSVDIDRTDLIKIKLFNSDDYFFMGVVRKVPIDGSTKAEYNYSGFGLTDYFVRINTESQSYAAQTIEEIIIDLLDNIIIPKTPIVKNTAKINVPNITLTTFDINYTQLPEVLTALKKIAASDGNQYIIGVDEVGEFFFKPRDTETKATLVVGKDGRYGIDSYEPSDKYNAHTKYFVLDKDGGYITTITSTEDNDIFEQKITAPDVDNTTAEKWAEGILTEKEVITRSASIVWKIEEQDPLFLKANGRIRIISNIPPESAAAPSSNPWGSGTWGSGLWGGGQYTGKDIDDILRVMRVKYILTGSQSIRQIQLGALPIKLDSEIQKVNQDLLELRISLGR